MGYGVRAPEVEPCWPRLAACMMALWAAGRSTAKARTRDRLEVVGYLVQAPVVELWNACAEAAIVVGEGVVGLQHHKEELRCRG